VVKIPSDGDPCKSELESSAQAPTRCSQLSRMTITRCSLRWLIKVWVIPPLVKDGGAAGRNISGLAYFSLGRLLIRWKRVGADRFELTASPLLGICPRRI
jgi:hypothetical protein